MKTSTTTRVIAIDALKNILQRRKHADEEIYSCFASHPHLTRLDRSFIHEMVYGSLRWLYKMDWIAAKLIDRPLNAVDPRVLNALRIGMYQIYYMDRVPDRAAVSETVEATKSMGVGHAASFVNGVLRNVARRTEYFKKPDKEKEPVAYYSMHYSYPPWLIERWNDHLPAKRLEFLLEKTNEVPQHFLKVFEKKITTEELSYFFLKEYGIHCNPLPLEGCIQVSRLPDIAKCTYYQKGFYQIQSETSQLMASLVNKDHDGYLLDACASPGKKLLCLLDEGFDQDKVIAYEIYPKRAKILNDEIRRAGFKLGNPVVTADISKSDLNREFHNILLDAPCSSLGVIQRHPEMKWLKKPQDIEHYAQVQKEILEHLAPSVAIGGELLYTVCSFEPEETTEQIDLFLRNHTEFQRYNILERVHPYYQKYLKSNHEIIIYPGNTDSLDGFFGVVLKRVK